MLLTLLLTHITLLMLLWQDDVKENKQLYKTTNLRGENFISTTPL